MTETRVLGLGYVGIPLAVAFDAAGHDVVGFDVDSDRAAALQAGRDPTGEVEDLSDCDADFTADPGDLDGFDYAFLTVPTPVDDWKRPDLSAVAAAGRTVGDHLDPGATVVLESTVYPGGTREVLVPALESASGLSAGTDFSVGYSPERLEPGPSVGREAEIEKTNKVVSAWDDEALADLVRVYESIVDATVHPAPSIETAEAAKCLENVQRDVNIALVNEFFEGARELDVDLDPQAVLAAARTKQSFHDYRPGIVGGHCIPIDPYLLSERFARSGFHAEVIESARRTNESFPTFLAAEVVRNVGRIRQTGRADGVGVDADLAAQPDRENVRALVMGVAYKSNVSDVRNDSLRTLVEELASYGVAVAGHDPRVDDDSVASFGAEPVADPSFGAYDAVLVTALHDEFRESGLEEYATEGELPYVLDLTGYFQPPTGQQSPEIDVS